MPARNSREAPPPVETCEISDVTPAFASAATESPPPTTVVAPAAVALYRVLTRIGIESSYRRHFWRYLRDLVALRLRGCDIRLLEVVLQSVPNAHHLIEWGRRLVEESDAADAARANVEELELPVNEPAGAPAGQTVVA